MKSQVPFSLISWYNWTYAGKILSLPWWNPSFFFHGLWFCKRITIWFGKVKTPKLILIFFQFYRSVGSMPVEIHQVWLATPRVLSLTASFFFSFFAFLYTVLSLSFFRQAKIRPRLTTPEEAKKHKGRSEGNSELQNHFKLPRLYILVEDEKGIPPFSLRQGKQTGTSPTSILLLKFQWPSPPVMGEESVPDPAGRTHHFSRSMLVIMDTSLLYLNTSTKFNSSWRLSLNSWCIL